MNINFKTIVDLKNEYSIFIANERLVYVSASQNSIQHSRYANGVSIEIYINDNKNLSSYV